jgi:hypothetical protein
MYNIFEITKKYIMVNVLEVLRGKGFRRDMVNMAMKGKW